MGESGAGKSTLIHLLLGFVAPTSGAVSIGGRNLQAVDLDSWRRQCAWIGQQPVLFSGTLRENIALARPAASRARIDAAARQAGLSEMADGLHAGYDTHVGEHGLGLSVGQAQRVALARAFIKDAPLLLLDEPTASLDQNTEARVLADLEGWIAGRTLIMATHRPAPLRLAQRIIILKEGRVVADGTHRELSKTHPELLPGVE